MIIIRKIISFAELKPLIFFLIVLVIRVSFYIETAYIAESLIFIILLRGNRYIKRFVIVRTVFLKEYILLEVSSNFYYYYFYEEYTPFFISFFLKLNPNNFITFIRFPNKVNYIGLYSSVKSNLRDSFN